MQNTKLFITLFTLTFLSFASFATDTISNNATHESFCSKLFYTGSFAMARSQFQTTPKRAMKDALKRLEKKFNRIKTKCENDGGDFRNCKPTIRSKSARRRNIKVAIVRYHCSL